MPGGDGSGGGRSENKKNASRPQTLPPPRSLVVVALACTRLTAVTARVIFCSIGHRSDPSAISITITVRPANAFRYFGRPVPGATGGRERFYEKRTKPTNPLSPFSSIGRQNKRIWLFGRENSFRKTFTGSPRAYMYTREPPLSESSQMSRISIRVGHPRSPRRALNPRTRSLFNGRVRPTFNFTGPRSSSRRRPFVPWKR